MDKININRWFTLQYFQNLAWTIGNLFLSVFIWQKSSGVDYLYRYYLTLFFMIPIFGFMGALLSKKAGQGVSFFIAFLSNLTLLVFAAVRPEYFLGSPYVFGAINASAVGFFSIPKNAGFQIMFSKNMSGMSAKLESLTKINSVLVPILGSLWVYFAGGYTGIFLLGTLAILISIFFTFITHFPKGSTNWNSRVLGDFIRNNDYRRLSFLWVLNGIKSGLEWSVFGIVVLKLVEGKITSWGVINFFAALVGVIAGIIYSKYIAGKNDPTALVLSCTLYAFLGVFVVSGFSLISFVLYFLGASLVSTFLSAALSRLFGDVFTQGGGDVNSTEEFYSFLEVPLALGRIIPVSILLFTNSKLDQGIILMGIFFVVSIIPLLTTYVLERMRSFRIEVGKEVYGH
jgi:hypothetical protein